MPTVQVPALVLWIVGVITVPVFGWAFALHLMVWHGLQINRELMVMHKNADAHGFGTVAMAKVIENQDRALKALVHYIRWFVEQQTGQKPPPPPTIMDGD